jgi:hypothetical protein
LGPKIRGQLLIAFPIREISKNNCGDSWATFYLVLQGGSKYHKTTFLQKSKLLTPEME